jgi:glutathione S-transferase
MKVVGAMATRAFRVLWVCEELEIEYEHVPAPIRSAQALELSPTGKIPAVVVDSTAITDSVAIMTYLTDKHQGLTFPAGTIERAQQDAHMHFIIDEIDGVLWTHAKHTHALPEHMRIANVTEALKVEFAQSLERLDARLTGTFLMGDTLTLPDLLAVHCLNWARGVGFPTGSDKLRAYAKRLRDRPSFKAVRALP